MEVPARASTARRGAKGRIGGVEEKVVAVVAWVVVWVGGGWMLNVKGGGGGGMHATYL